MHTGEDNIKMDFKEVGYDDVDWSHLVQDRDQCEHDNEPLVSIKSREFLD